MTTTRYVIVSPVRNEQEYIGKTVESVAAQTIRPIRWVIVDDGSTDQTGKLIDEAAKRFSWIQCLHRSDRGFRRAGGGVMEAFDDGFNLLTGETWEYLVKLDGDVTLEPEYFEQCLAQFAQNPRLGIAGGLVCNLINGELQPESKVDPAFHVRGATKIYKYECWKEIGGLIQAAGWDTVDELKANMLGWTTRTFPDIKLIHHRPAGGAYGTWPNWVKNGRANYVAGYHSLFMLLKCARRVFERPYGIGALGLLVGYYGGCLGRTSRVNDPDLIRYFRRQQMQRLLGRPSLWS